MTALVAAGELALATALRAHRLRIVDPPRSTWRDPAYTASRVWIDGIIRGPHGLGWSRCSPLVRVYRHDGDYEWCGAFAGHCWRAAGLDPELAQVYWSSTYRLDRYSARRRAFWTLRERRLRSRLDGTGRERLEVRHETTLDEVLEWGPRAGDVLLVDTRGRWGYGHHVTIVERVDFERAVAFTVEGNATGKLPDGTTAQGVVRQVRPMSVWRRFLRPSVLDLTRAVS